MPTLGYAPAYHLLFIHFKVFGAHGAAAIARELVSRGVSLEFVQDEGLVIIEDIFPGITSPVASYVTNSKFYSQDDLACVKCLQKCFYLCTELVLQRKVQCL